MADYGGILPVAIWLNPPDVINTKVAVLQKLAVVNHLSSGRHFHIARFPHYHFIRKMQQNRNSRYRPYLTSVVFDGWAP